MAGSIVGTSGLRIGIDAGTEQIKVAALSPGGEVVARWVQPTGPDWPGRLEPLLEEVRVQSGCASLVGSIVATGAGRHSVPGAAKRVHGVLSQAAGVRHSEVSARGIVDLGAGSTKVIRLGSAGEPEDFWVDREWTACTSRLLRLLARAAEAHGEDPGEEEPATDGRADWSRISPEHLEHEVIHRLARGESPEALAAGVKRAKAERILRTAPQGRGAAECQGRWALTGGGASDRGMVEALGGLVEGVEVVAQSLWTAAMGAALLGGPSRSAAFASTGTRRGRPGRGRAAGHLRPAEGFRPSRASVRDGRPSGPAGMG